MAVTLTGEEGGGVGAAQAKSSAVRAWRRYQAVLLRADGLEVAEVARVLRCTETSVCNWTAAWRADGVAGVAEGVHPGKAPCLAPEAEAALSAPLGESGPQAHCHPPTGWTVPLLRTSAAQPGWIHARGTSPPPP